MSTFTVTVTEDQYRQLSRVGETPTLAQSWPDQWVDWGDHTVQVDPMGNSQWIHDSHDGHTRSQNRGRYYDKLDVEALQGWEQRHNSEEVEYYTPNDGYIDSLDKFSTPLSRGCRMWRGAVRDSRRFGQLPSITAMLYENKLPDKSTAQIESEMRESERTAAHRLFARDGYTR